MSIPEITVDLSLPPTERWPALFDFLPAMEELYDGQLRDYTDVAPPNDMLLSYMDSFVPKDIQHEIAFITGLADRPITEILLLNLYYDALKAVLGCSSFAVDTPDGPLHARNLDWFSDGDLLRKHSLITHFIGGKNKFSTVGWPGFVGALSGVAPGKFAVTLNAVLSNESAAMAPPITMVLRDVLANAASFEEARHRLETEEIFSDCLLLLSGTQAGEMTVIERTPTRSALRKPINGTVQVTNDYRELTDLNVSDSSELSRTACDRYDRMAELIQAKAPGNPDECYTLLDDSGIRMQSTMQQMVFQAATGVLTAR